MLWEEELFQNNTADIQSSNLKVLKGLLFVVIPLLMGLGEKLNKVVRGLHIENKRTT